MLSSSTRRSLLASTIIAGSLISTQALAQGGAQGGINAGTNAQQSEAVTEPSTPETIVVTGSLIQNPNLTSATPVSVIGQDEVLLRQTQTAEQILRQLPGAVPDIGENVNNGTNGSATVNLRGLGTNRNLVLLDGARIVPTSNDGATDLNNIPLSLVQRVDVLTGGASTTYGADAVSGVVNFITRRDFTGLELQVQEAITERGDANRLRADLTLGASFDDGRGNAVLSIGYQEADPLYQDARPISFTGITSNTGVSGGESFTSTPTGISFANGDFQINPAGTALVPFYQGFNFNPYNVFQTPLKRYNMYASANYQASDSVNVYARGLFTKSSVKQIIAPSGIFGTALCVNPDNPYLNATIRAQIIANNTTSGSAYQCDTNIALTGAQVRTPNAGAGYLTLPGVYRRATELGPRISDFTSQVFDFRVGAQVNITDHLKFDGYGAYGETDRVETRSGYYALSRVRQALIATSTTTCTNASNGCVPLNIFGPQGSITAAQNAFVGGITSSVKNFQSLAQAHGVLSGDFGFNSPFSDEAVAFAVGGEFRRYGAQRSPDNLAQVPGELGGAGGAVTPLRGGYHVYEGFGELKVPLVTDRPFFNELTLEAGVRYSRYSVDTGGSFNATTWKAGGTWSPVDAIKIRGNYQRAVRAPNIGELFAPVSTGLVSLASDPCAGTAPVNNANLRAICIAQGAPATSIGLIQNPSAGQANATGGGNLNLKPEKANTYTVGVVIEPRNLIEGFTFTADYYNIKVRDAVSSPTPFDVISACFGTDPTNPPANAGNAACTSIRRNPANGRLSGDSATVPGLPTPLSNLGRLATDGIDVTANYRTSLGFLSDAKLALSFAGNWTNKAKFQATPSSVFRDCVGLSSVNCASIQPKFTWNQRTTLTFGDIDVSLLWRHIGKIDYEGTEADFIARGFNANNRFLFPYSAGVTAPLRGGIIGGTGPLAGTGPYDFNHIKAYDYFDLTTRFGVTKNLDLTLSVTNLFDKDPPLVGASGFNTTGFNSGNTLPSTYDSLGRRYSVTARLKL